MSDQPSLDSLTLKDLRKLAGEHQVPNRSSLNKQELLGALSAALRGRLGAAAAAKPAAEKPAPEAKPAATEPEVLDPSSVAGFVSKSSPKAKPQATEAADESTADRNDSAEDVASDATSDSEGEEPRKRKRRRRRRRGKGRDNAEDSNDSGSEANDNDNDNSDDTANDDDEQDASAPAVKKDAPVPKAPPAAEVPARAENRPQPRPAPAAQASSEQAEQRPVRPPKPRLQGQQRSLPAVLDRLRAFSSGILELCDPQTPSWAQARLGELLAEIGVVPTPCDGLPHGDFHRVAGEAAVDGVSPGHISVIDEPGFSLRGDRGDLFPLRKAVVKVAPGGSPAPESSERTGHSRAPQVTDRAEPAAAAERAATDSPPAEQPTQASPEAGEDAPRPKAATAAPRPEGRRRDAPRQRSSLDLEDPISPAAAIVAEADEEAAIEIAAEPPPLPRVAPGRRHRAADTAPTLPLQPIDADELAGRDKAEAFRPLGLNEQILADLHNMGYVQPSPIQAAAIPVILTGRDLIGQALTGTGKTAAFMLPVLNQLYNLEGEGPVALVMCPTRELARQVHHEATRMAGTSGARAALIYGGVGMDDQIEALSRNPHIVVGTPGRLIDHMRRRNLITSRIQMVVLDEADQMLDIGFLPDITYILKHTPATRQTMLFSATMPDEIKRLSADYMREPEHVHTMPESVTVDKVDQKFVAVDHDKKVMVLAHFIETREPEQMVVFCKTKHQTDRVARVLKAKKLSAGAIHGDLSQAKREQTLRQFREGTLTCLIATNVAARGLDIPSVSHVVNYDVPETPEEYVHRIGRTGRMGKEGIARTFITPEDGQFLLEIEKHIGILLEEEVIEGITASTAVAPQRSTSNAPSAGMPRLLKPIAGGIRLGRRRR